MNVRTLFRGYLRTATMNEMERFYREGRISQRVYERFERLWVLARCRFSTPTVPARLNRHRARVWRALITTGIIEGR
jgi:hypothetical protein